MKFSLLVSEGVHKGKQIPITLSEFVIGRDPQCHLRPASPMISKRHCALVVREDHAFVKDYESTNGTLVNEQKIEGEKELCDGDQLKIGPLSFKVVLETSVPVDKRTPIPKTKAAMANDEDAAAVLLDGGQETPTPYDEEGVPTGSTVMEIPAAVLEGNKQSATPKEVYRPAQPKGPSSGNTSTAADAILNKYMRRERK